MASNLGKRTSSKRNLAEKVSSRKEQALSEKQFNTLLAEKKAIREKYKDKTEAQDNNIKMLEETLAAEKRWADKYDKRKSKSSEDKKNTQRYGNDAMKGRGFAQYNKGGMVKSNCGASMKPNGRAKK